MQHKSAVQCVFDNEYLLFNMFKCDPMLKYSLFGVNKACTAAAKRAFANEDVDRILCNACWVGNVELVTCILQSSSRACVWPAATWKGQPMEDVYVGNDVVDLSTALFHACYGNHRAIVDLLYEHGCTSMKSGFDGACAGGHLDLVKYMMELGPTDCSVGLAYACESGHKDVVEWLLNYGFRFRYWMIDVAAKNGHYDIVEMILQRQVGPRVDWLAMACGYGHRHLAQILFDNGAKWCSVCLNEKHIRNR